MLNKKEPLISVGIMSGEKISIIFEGEFFIDGSQQAISGPFIAELKDDIIYCHSENAKFESSKEIIFKPGNSENSFILKEVTIGIKFHWERKEDEKFKGSLKIIKDKQSLIVINILSVEDYLESVNSSEMSARSSIDLLKAHTIVTRSWLLAQMEKSDENKNIYPRESTQNEIIKWYDKEDHQYFDVCADDHCQRYQGITKITTEVVRKAVNDTSGIILESNGKICDARFSKSCGGISESFENVWEPVKHDYLSSIIDYSSIHDNFNLDFSIESNAEKWIKGNPPAFCNSKDKKVLSQILLDYDQETTDFYRWKIIYRQNEISELIKKKSGIDFGDILDLVPIERGASARLIKLKIIGSKKTLIIGKELEIRRFLSESHLYSSAIIIEKSEIKANIPQKFLIYGAGWGHGVGLCQIGAAVMAENGYKYEEILLHYFKGSNLKKIY